MANAGGIGTARLTSLLDGEGDVPMTTIDETVRELGLPSVDFVKMDVEGAEPLALRGAAESIARFRPRLSLCTYHDTEHPRLLREMVSAMYPGYSFEQTPFKLHAHAPEEPPR